MFYYDQMNNKCIPTAESWLRENSNLGSRQRKAMSAMCPTLINTLAVSSRRNLPLLISIGGAPGSGKSTLARMLTAVLVKSGQRCQMVSLDDYYLPFAERQQLARHIHPLCGVRGVPGTHDLALLSQHLERLLQGDISGLAMPEFDKASDDRRTSTKSCSFAAPLDYVVLEGWMCGAPPQSEEALSKPVNPLESEQDVGEIWRQWVNLHLQKFDHMINQRVNLRWYLRAPDWDSIIDWRWQQEQELPLKALKSRTDVAHFLAHYQRLVEHMQATAETWSDLIISLNASHCATIS